MSDAKISPALSEALGAAAEDDVVEVVVELAMPAGGERAAAQPGGDRAARVAAARSGFERESAPVEAAIRRAGGEVVSRAWLNQTVLARLPRRALDAVCGLRQVRRLDRTHRIEPE
jgi:hypothetical protein